ncbi:hypothetical protein HMPREF0653_02452 [Prevotella disiens JCM 6334 = ATCC 29426]|uniref:Uncharacterized protein n=1 Tax=Prevotella disiens JCM 6334 = ATCC 29426 TaxID=1235811 RepID=A0ABN0NP66_9BACT|nr:hypothetical protein HMPREF0653_02452 [Prevotella disiens JCM 6334 = ATCC 29426]
MKSDLSENPFPQFTPFKYQIAKPTVLKHKTACFMLQNSGFYFCKSLVIQMGNVVGA